MKGALVVVVLILTAVVANMACGGPDKPPMVPDGPDTTTMSAEGGAPTAPPAK
jgi:hypothetical protein